MKDNDYNYYWIIGTLILILGMFFYYTLSFNQGTFNLVSNESFNEGYLTGVNETYIYINQLLLKLAATCEPIVLDYPDGMELNLVAIECHNQTDG